MADPVVSEDKLFRLLSLPRCENCKAELLKALFVVFGTVTDPDKGLHLEFLAKDPLSRDFIRQVLISSGFDPKTSARNGYFTCYFKDGDVIKDVFGKMGVNSVVFDVINRKMIGEIRNSANRLVNFETANIKKSIGASAKYIEAIKYLDSLGMVSTLPPELEEAANLRMENFQMSLSELARQTKPPVSKSGFLHRLDRILEIAEKVKKRGESRSDE
ncbi:MAG: DNA-binding protein WhiA [Clostridia bacterium]|nr:DNA-binding protein WhiA [Clostridia bacterium]